MHQICTSLMAGIEVLTRSIAPMFSLVSVKDSDTPDAGCLHPNSSLIYNNILG